MIRVRCSGCSKVVAFADEKAGSIIKCPACGKSFRAPTAAKDNPSSSAEAKRRPVAKKRAPEPAPEAEDEEPLDVIALEKEPEKRVRKSRGRRRARRPSFSIGKMLHGILDSRFVWVGAVAIVMGCIVWYSAKDTQRLARSASKEPEKVSLKDLIARGTEGNPNVIVSDFALCDNIVYEANRVTGQWNSVWVPVVPHAGARSPEPVVANGPIQALIYSHNVHGQDEIPRLNVSEIQGLVINQLVSLKAEEQRLLREGYPNTDFSRCLIIHEGRAPPTSTEYSLFGVGGILAILVGIGSIVWGCRESYTSAMG